MSRLRQLGCVGGQGGRKAMLLPDGGKGSERKVLGRRGPRDTGACPEQVLPAHSGLSWEHGPQQGSPPTCRCLGALTWRLWGHGWSCAHLGVWLWGREQLRDQLRAARVITGQSRESCSDVIIPPHQGCCSAFTPPPSPTASVVSAPFQNTPRPGGGGLPAGKQLDPHLSLIRETPKPPASAGDGLSCPWLQAAKLRKLLPN